MKKFILLLFVSFLSLNTFCQVNTNPHKLNMGLGFGLGVYGGQSNDINDKNDTTAIDAACAIIKLNFEYSIINTLGVGFSFERNGFLSNKDSSDNASSLNFGLSLKFKFISKEFNTLYLDVIPAYSYFTYQKETNNHTDKIMSHGFNFQAGLGWDHYFGEHFGMYLSTYYTLYKYNLLYDDENYILKVNNPSENFKIKFSGMNVLKLGFLYRF